MPKGYTEDDLKGLSAAERAILEEDEDDTSGLDEIIDEGGDDTNAGAGGDGKEGADGADKDGKDGKEKPKPGEAGADDATTGADNNTEEEEATDTGVTYTRQTPEDAEKTRETLNTRKDEAFEKLMDGELTAAEYQKVEKEVAGELEKLLQASITDNVTATIEQGNTQKAWKAEVDALVKTAKEEGLDYKGDQKLLDEFNGLVRVFGAEAGERGMTDVGLKASKWALKQAHETMQRRHGKQPAAGDGKDTTGADKTKPGPRGKADLSVIPPNLGKAPIAADANIAEEFAHLDGLTGSALEKAVARLTPEQQDRYLA